MNNPMHWSGHTPRSSWTTLWRCVILLLMLLLVELAALTCFTASDIKTQMSHMQVVGAPATTQDYGQAQVKVGDVRWFCLTNDEKPVGCVLINPDGTIAGKEMPAE